MHTTGCQGTMVMMLPGKARSKRAVVLGVTEVEHCQNQYTQSLKQEDSGHVIELEPTLQHFSFSEEVLRLHL